VFIFYLLHERQMDFLLRPCYQRAAIQQELPPVSAK
jgi:hypothetical protein